MAAQFNLMKVRSLRVAQAMDGAGQKLFAGSGFALDEHGGIGWRDGCNLAQYIAQARAFAHDVVEPVFDVDLVFEIVFFLFQPVAQLGNLLESQGVVYRHGHLSRDLAQHLGLRAGENALSLRLATIMAPRVLSR